MSDLVRFGAVRNADRIWASTPQSRTSPAWRKVSRTWPPLDLVVFDEMFLKKRLRTEAVIRELKTQTQMGHTRQRNVENLQVNVFSALIAYQLLENKPSLCSKPMIHTGFLKHKLSQ